MTTASGTATVPAPATVPGELGGHGAPAGGSVPPGDPAAGARRVAWVVLGVQLAFLLVWSAVLYSRWAETYDFALRYQAWWGIAHGTFDPYVSVAHRFFWQDHFELIDWPLAPLSRLWPGALWPLWIQDLMVVGGEAGAVLMVSDALRRPGWPRRVPPWVAIGLVVVLLVANPWLYIGLSFDFHFQSVGAAAFAVLALREVIRGRHRLLALWVALCLFCGDIAGTYLAAVGLSGIVAGWVGARWPGVEAVAGEARGWRRRGAVVAGVGVLWFVFVSLVGGNRGSELASHYSYLAPGRASIGIAAIVVGIVVHPGRVVARLWASRVDLWAYASSSGLLGLATPWSLLPLLVLVESGAGQDPLLRSIAYENIGAVLVMAPLSVLVLGSIARRLARREESVSDAPAPDAPAPDATGRGGVRGSRARRANTARWVPTVLAAVLAANALGWALAWLPQLPSEWLRVTPAASAELDRVAAAIPASSEVIASQGVIGRLAGRRWLYEIAGGSRRFPLHTASTYVVVVPYQGIEVASVRAQLGLLAYLATDRHAQLVMAGSDVWLFRVARVQGVRELRVPPPPDHLPTWGLTGATGTAVLSGPPSGWHVVRTGGRPGYVVDGADWHLPPGRYRARVALASDVPTVVEVWDASAQVLLARRDVAPTRTPRRVSLTVRVTDTGRQTVYGGWGPFSFSALPPPVDDRIEIRVWAGRPGKVAVYSVGLFPARGA